MWAQWGDPIACGLLKLKGGAFVIYLMDCSVIWRIDKELLYYYINKMTAMQ